MTLLGLIKFNYFQLGGYIFHFYQMNLINFLVTTSSIFLQLKAFHNSVFTYFKTNVCIFVVSC